MAALITEQIPDPSFLTIQNKIAEILLLEITNQHTMQSLDSVFEIYTERIEPYDKSEDVMISIAMREGDYDEFSNASEQEQNMYFIDVFCGGIESDQKSLSIDVRDKLFKYVGMIRYILSSAKYRTLGFPPGLIGNRYIKKITFDTDYSNWGNHSNYDANGIRFCRIYYLVKTVESTEAWSGIEFQGNDTVINYETSDKGIKLVFNN